MVAIRRYWNIRKFYDIYGIIEIEEWLQSIIYIPYIFIGRRFYKLINIIYSTHLILGRCNNKNIFYINNYINFNQFNTLYNLEFKEKGIYTIFKIVNIYF